MKSSALARYSITALALVSLGVTALQTLHFDITIPFQHLRIAWSITNALIQL